MPLWRDPQNGKYRIQFQFQGRRHSKTGFVTQKAAERWQVDKLKELEEEAKTPPSPPTQSASDSGPLTLEGLMVAYLRIAERTLAPKSLSYRKTVFRRFLHHAGNVPANLLTATQVEDYLLTRPTNHNFNKDRVEIHRLFSWAHRRQMVPANPAYLVEKLSVDRSQKVIPTPEGMAKMLMAAGPDRPLLLVLFHTMARIDEILRLKWEDVNFQEKAVRLWTRKRKGGSWESDTLPMNSDLEAVLWGLWKKRQQDIWVFFNQKTRTRYGYRPKLMATICKRAGIEKFGFHEIRHFVASLLYDKKKISLPVISKLLRHKNLRTTEIYLHAVAPEYRETMQLLEGNVLEGLGEVINGKVESNP